MFTLCGPASAFNVIPVNGRGFSILRSTWHFYPIDSTSVLCLCTTEDKQLGLFISINACTIRQSLTDESLRLKAAGNLTKNFWIQNGPLYQANLLHF